jgi:predicted outer membrane protein
VSGGLSVSSRSAVAAVVAALVVGAAPATAQARVGAGPQARAPSDAASQTDLDFVRRVHLTVVSVSPASALARAVSAHTAVKNLARQINEQNNELDGLVRTTATALKVSLANAVPAAEQNAFATLQGHTGSVFEADYVNYLWAADSSLLPIAMAVSGSTTNAAVRRLAERTDTVVGGQLPLLQKSGLLRMAVLPAPSASTTAGARLPGGVPQNQSLKAQARSGAGFLAPTLGVRLVVLAAALCLVGALTWRLVTRSAAPSRRRGRRRSRPATTGTAAGPAGGATGRHGLRRSR